MDNEERKRIWQQFMEKGTLDPLLPPLVAQSWQECRRRGVDDMTQEEYRKAAIDACQKLADDVGIPADYPNWAYRKKTSTSLPTLPWPMPAHQAIPVT